MKAKTRNVLLGSAILTLAGWNGAAAQTAAPTQLAELQSDDITIVATRSEARVDEVPATVSVITAEEIEENLANDIKDLVRFEPGVSVQTQPARFNAAGSGTGRTGNAGFNIRGLDGNRVLVAIDGVRVPDAYSFSAVQFGRGDYIDIDLVQSVEILRGPASSLYGSDGLAGVVSFTTRDPASFIQDDETFGFRARAGYASADESTTESLIGAARSGAWSGLVAYSRRDGQETENQGENETATSARTAPNPQDWHSNAVLGRVVFEPSAAHRFRLTAEYADRESTANILSARGVATGVTTTNVLTDDASERTRVSFDHTYENEGGLIERAFWNVYVQSSEAVQYTFEDRFTGSPLVVSDRSRESTYTNDVWGGGLQLNSSFDAHRLTYGFDYTLTQQEGLRNGAPDTATDDFPVRPFPNTDWTLAGAYLQDEISLLNGRLVLSPAVRYDYYEIAPEDDALYLGTPAAQDDSHVTPKFGAVGWFTDQFGAFFSYSAGFKSPAPSQVNEFFQNLVGPFAYYEVIPNPNLEPETSESYEVGLRLRDVRFGGGAWNAQISGYSGEYEDFIDRAVISGTGTSFANRIVYQYVNLANVEISGAEARLTGEWENGFGFNLAAAISEGEATQNGVRAPLNSIDPLKVVAGLSYDDPSGRFGGQAIVTHVGEKDRSDIAGAIYATDSFTLLDLTAYWNVTDAATIRAGVFNVTDESYIWWNDARDLTLANSAIADAYTQPGRNFSVSVAYRF